MSTAAAEAVFTTPKLEMVFLSPSAAAQADHPLLAAPKFFQDEFECPPEPGFAAELIESPPPPGVSKAQIFPLGIRFKGGSEFLGIAHLILGFPTETTVFVGLLVLAEAAQRNKLGKEFIEGVYAWARPQGIQFIRVRCHPRHKGAEAFLDKMGFVDLPTALSSGHKVWERKLPAVED